jgi:hypothetical protein
MTLEEVDDSLPNGLHDARIQSVSMDYERGTLALAVSVWIGTLDAQPPNRDRCRGGVLEFEGVAVFALEPPRPDSSYRHSGALAFSWRRESHDSIRLEVGRALSDEELAYSLFIEDWLSTMVIIARTVSFRWLDDPSRN